MNVQPKLQTCDPMPAGEAAAPLGMSSPQQAPIAPSARAPRRLPTGPRAYATRISPEEGWPLELEVEPWRP